MNSRELLRKSCSLKYEILLLREFPCSLRKLDVYLLSGLKAAAVTILKKILKTDLLLCVVSIHPQPTVFIPTLLCI